MDKPFLMDHTKGGTAMKKPKVSPLWIIMPIVMAALICTLILLAPPKDPGGKQNTAVIQQPAPGEYAAPPNKGSNSIKHTPIKLDHAVIAFTFDDGYQSDYDLAYPILKKYGINGTSYIIGKYPDGNVPNTLNWDEIKKMYATGWDFGCHTYAHIRLTTMTPDEIRQSMEMENASFQRNGLPIPDIHAFPYGAYNQQVIDVIKEYRKQMRKAYYEEKFVDLNHVNPYEIDCISADMHSNKLLDAKEKLVDKACAEDAVIVFRVHCMYRENRNDMGKWPVQTDSRLFAKLVDYCVSKGCWFVTMDQLEQMYS